MTPRNPIDTNGFDFLEFTTLEPQKLSAQFESMGFHLCAHHQDYPVTIYQQNEVRFIINLAKDSHASQYAKYHGASISAVGFKVRDANTALQYVRLKGATPYQPLDEKIVYDMPAIYGIGNTLIYFVDYSNDIPNYMRQFPDYKQPSSGKFSYLDHVTFDLYRGHLIKWMDFYARLFNFQEASVATRENKIPGFKSKTMLSPCGKIRICLNESSDEKSKIEAFLNHFNGEGIQRIALGGNVNTADLTFLETQDLIQEERAAVIS